MALLAELVDRIDAATDKPIELRIVGGAAIAAGYNPARAATDDVDSLETSDINAVHAAAAQVARSHDLDDDWVNFKVRMYAPDPMYPAPEWTVLFEKGNARILVGNPRLLLAMKIRAGRPNRDFADIDVLLRECRIGSFSKALECFEEHYTTDVMKAVVETYLRSHLDP